jgi:hypothetical protein
LVDLMDGYTNAAQQVSGGGGSIEIKKKVTVAFECWALSLNDGYFFLFCSCRTMGNREWERGKSLLISTKSALSLKVCVFN